MDSLIERAFRGEATETELAELASWRASAEENERHYGEVVRILDAAALLRSELSAAAPPPSYAAVLARKAARGAARPGSIGAGRRSTDWRRSAPWLVAAAALLLMFVNVFQPFSGRIEAPAHHAEVVTGVGEIATVQLTDGSVVRLAPDSRLRLGENGDARAVVLDGRAFFSVAQVSGRPFRVRTDAGTATVLGTRFEIRTRADELQLVVVEGRVALEAPANRVVVAAGEHSAVVNRVAAEPTPVADAERMLSWTGRFLAFQATPLRDAAREIAAMYGVRISIADRDLGEQTVTAVFTGQDLDAVLAVMCEIVNARCVVRADEITINPR